MLSEIHTALKRLLYERGRIPHNEVDISFEMPTREWVDSLIRPTINLFMFDIRENTDLRSVTRQTSQVGGRAIMRMPPRRFDLRYMLSAPSTVAADEHLLLWRGLATILKYSPIPSEYIPDSIPADLSISTAMLSADDGVSQIELWNALEVTPRPALLFSVTVPLDLDVVFEAPVVLSRTTRFTRRTPEAEAAGQGIREDQAVVVDSGIQIGGVIRNASGLPVEGAVVRVVGSGAPDIVTGANGYYIVRNVRDQQIAIQVAGAGLEPQIVEMAVPSESYDIVLQVNP